MDELSKHSAEFRHHWARHTVRTKAHGVKLIDHPHLGILRLAYEITHFPQDAELSPLICTAAPGTPEEQALRALAET